jgi:invasion protein IalB
MTGVCMFGKNIKAAAAVALVSFVTQPSIVAAQTETPVAAGNNAFSVNETHGDWIVLCSKAEAKQICLMTQQQRKNDTKQLVIAAEISTDQNDQIRGTIILPFGLQLAAGVTVQVDDGVVSNPSPFATCLPTGCIVQVLLDAPTLQTLRGGSNVKLVAKAHDSGQNVLLGLSLKGFSTALDRLVALSK